MGLKKNLTLFLLQKNQKNLVKFLITNHYGNIFKKLNIEFPKYSTNNKYSIFRLFKKLFHNFNFLIDKINKNKMDSM